MPKKRKVGETNGVLLGERMLEIRFGNSVITKNVFFLFVVALYVYSYEEILVIALYVYSDKEILVVKFYTYTDKMILVVL